MVTMAQRIEELRTKKAMSRPALAAALGLPRLSIEKFETGRQTPTQEQQQKLASAFGVSIAYLRGETDDPTSMDNWLSVFGANSLYIRKPCTIFFYEKVVKWWSYL